MTPLQSIEVAIMIAFEAGKWVGQVELEEHYDREQYSFAALESVHSKKTAMPLASASIGRTVTVNLRSEAWRAGVRAEAEQLINKAREIFNKEQTK